MSPIFMGFYCIGIKSVATNLQNSTFFLTLAERRLQICNNKRFSNPRGDGATNLSRQIRNNIRHSNPRGEEITDFSRLHRGDKKTVANGSAMWYIVKYSQSDC